ncbi:MAG TPA: hypothetical protein VI300_15615 [Solirubrobacter sp.]
MHLDLVRDHSVVRNGDVINYQAVIDNIGPLACDTSGININLQFPQSDGTPSPVLQAVSNNVSYVAQAGKQTSKPFAYTVNAAPGVTRLEARDSIVNGILHDGGVHSAININKTIGSSVFTPSITIDKVGSMTGPAPAPQTVVYTFYVRNGADPALDETATALSNVKVTDDKCGSPTYVSGDANNDQKLETSETWAFQCTLTHPTAGTYTNVAVANGENILYGRSVPVVSPPDNWTVILTAPPLASPPPQGSVKPVSINQAPCTMARVNSTTVRAGQLNTIRVRVRNVDAGSTVTITLPGGKKVTAKTDKSGLATFRVRPTKTGTAKIEAAECSDTESVAVKAARRVVAQKKPRVTG